MKIDIPKTAGVQTAIRIPEEHYKVIENLAKENKCEKSEVIRFMIKSFIEINNI